MAVKAKEFTYTIGLESSGVVTADASPLDLDQAWTPEHLVLAALIRCSLQSLRYHAARAGIDDAVGSGSASGRVTKRESDGRYAFVSLEVELDVELDAAPEDLRGLLDKAERDCFVGASLTVPPRYRWRVDGEEL